MNNHDRNEFSNLVQETLEKEPDGDEAISRVLVLDVNIQENEVFSKSPFFQIPFKAILLNSVYVLHNNYEVIVFNKVLCDTFSLSTGIPKMYIACSFCGDRGHMYIARDEEELLEALEFASSDLLAG